MLSLLRDNFFWRRLVTFMARPPLIKGGIEVIATRREPGATHESEHVICEQLGQHSGFSDSSIGPLSTCRVKESHLAPRQDHDRFWREADSSWRRALRRLSGVKQTHLAPTLDVGF